MYLGAHPVVVGRRLGGAQHEVVPLGGINDERVDGERLNLYSTINERAR